MTTLRFNLNGQWVEDATVPPTTTLLRYLRDVRSLTGTKEGCAEGDCGACTVAVVERGADGQPTYRAINACLVLLPMVQGKHIVTVEALKGPEYHPAQQAMAKALGSQCGYCTPGIVMSLFEATYRRDLERAWQVDDQLCGNLCRCTGYRPIREAAGSVAGSCPRDRFSEALPKLAPGSIAFRREENGQLYSTPTTFEGLFGELAANPDARFVSGGTDLSLEITKRFQIPPKLISLEGLTELRVLEERSTGFFLGSGAALSDLETFSATRLPPLHRMLRYFAARQIKHRGTLGGNLCTASPIGDLPPALISLGAVAVLRSAKGDRRVPLEDFFVGYRKTALAAQEVLLGVEVPKLDGSVRAASYKVSKRRELDISAVSAGLWVQVSAAGRIEAARFAFGGMAATPKRATAAEQVVIGQPFVAETFERAATSLDFTPVSDHRGSAKYRALVAANLLRGFFEEVSVSALPSLSPGHAATVLTAEEVRHG